MTIQELFVAANRALEASISQIKDDQWELDMPPGTSMKPSTLRQAVQYHTYDDAWVPDVLAGKTKDEVGDQYEALLTNDTVLESYKEYNHRANEAVSSFNELDKTTHLSYGDFPAGEYLQHITSFRAFRSYDIAKLIGIDTRMDPEFVQALIDEFTPVIEFYRSVGVFPPALPVADDATPQQKLLAMVGRQ
ncbi:MAG: hypothetical protein JWN38_521 [Candidatus Saccharibacteria bacterium]|nr:hypothetical protein [Candidatus Saccharibacteria bacterium]